jgi:hypothetical protein
MTDTTFVSRYEQRVTFVQDVLQKNTELDDNAARDLAVKVVYAIDHVPEPTRRTTEPNRPRARYGSHQSTRRR